MMYLDTWRVIATHLGRSERWCRYMAQLPQDPLPAFRFGGTVRVVVADLDTWAGRPHLSWWAGSTRKLPNPDPGAVATIPRMPSRCSYCHALGHYRPRCEILKLHNKQEVTR